MIDAVIVRPVDPDTGPTEDTVELVKVNGVLEEFQSIVDGRIEGVFGRDFVMYVNEEGLIHGLPFNEKASAFLAVRSETGMSPHIFGTIVILGGGDPEGNETTVEQFVLDYFNIKEK